MTQTQRLLGLSISLDQTFPDVCRRDLVEGYQTASRMLPAALTCSLLRPIHSVFPATRFPQTSFRRTKLIP
ncbi:uncharacterized protein BDZ99DRAFT_460083 [Mytilinidion resinicola]|uniref:Uncharacterized protein n=1 Tax=Mytilinidion resinicola TaxID=574789 RepID=A0A6A6Z2H0_9PEZI|nr:uncharacterized protein BDZ99DRAFT_460083 [Mytilinidion resinicola]KAF2814427.1 hypothetical protein BDZ99DRAFT_460083 [Mytilinidion resinicola]